MPIYEYCCPSCKLEFELLRRMSQSDEGAVCPNCGSNAQRLPSLFGKSSQGSFGSAQGACSSCSSKSCSSCGL